MGAGGMDAGDRRSPLRYRYKKLVRMKHRRGRYVCIDSSGVMGPTGGRHGYCLYGRVWKPALQVGAYLMDLSIERLPVTSHNEHCYL